jgi:hypothetical protein
MVGEKAVRADRAMKRGPQFWIRHEQTSRGVAIAFCALLAAGWAIKLVTSQGTTPPAFLAIVAGLSLLEYLFARRAATKAREESKAKNDKEGRG